MPEFMVSTFTPTEPQRFEMRHNDTLNNMVLEKHSSNPSGQQLVEIEIEVTVQDITNMSAMKNDAARLVDMAKTRYTNLTLSQASNWTLEHIVSGTRYTYTLLNNGLQGNSQPGGAEFLKYLQLFEVDGLLREYYDFSPLSWPMIYLPVNRSAAGLNTTVELASFNEYESKRQNDAVHSRSGNSTAWVTPVAICQRVGICFSFGRRNKLVPFPNALVTSR